MPSSRPAATLDDGLRPILWRAGALRVLDQRLLPRRTLYRRCATSSQVARAIRSMTLRGAPLIGCAAAYGYALAARGRSSARRLREAERELTASRPTAVNLAHALARMREAERRLRKAGRPLADGLLEEAHAVLQEDLAANRRIAEFGARLLKPRSTLLTHCNAGALATAGIGTALGVVRAARRAGKARFVYACETRPYLQGSRLTLWELMREGVPCALLSDNMAAHIMATERVDAVIVGADRIAANGDTANKIGTYALALAARHHRIPFYVAAPLTTVDASLPRGELIPIEERDPREVLTLGGLRIAPAGAKARHPAFDVTPHRLITAIITDAGVARPPYRPTLKKLLSSTP